MEVYKALKTVLEITDATLLEKVVVQTCARYLFVRTGLHRWVLCKEQCGCCFRLGDGINKNMFCEAFHRTFKYNYLKGKFNKRVDTTLINLITFARDKVFESVIKLTKG